MKVLELAWEYPPHIVGGIGNHIAALAPGLRSLGADVCVITPRLAGGDAVETHDGLRIFRTQAPAHAGYLLDRVREANAGLVAAAAELFATGESFDIIHAHDWLVGAAGAALKTQHKIPLLATIHATERGRGQGHLQGDLAQAISQAEWRLTYEAWRVITVSEFMASELGSYFALSRDKVNVIPNGVDTRGYDALDAADTSDFRSRFARPDEKIVFNVGRVVYEKGAHVLVEAAPQILAAAPRTKFVVAGRGGMLDTLRQRAGSLGLTDKFFFTGYIDDSERDLLYKVADCAVFPSLYEPFGIVALEAMAARCPIVVADTGGLAEVVQPNVTGIIVLPLSVAGLANGIVETLWQPEQARARAQCAYDYVRRNHNWQAIATCTMQVMERIVQERSKTEW